MQTAKSYHVRYKFFDKKKKTDTSSTLQGPYSLISFSSMAIEIRKNYQPTKILTLALCQFHKDRQLLRTLEIQQAFSKFSTTKIIPMLRDKLSVFPSP